MEDETAGAAKLFDDLEDSAICKSAEFQVAYPED
jgi:hypothetical protein